MIDLTDIITAVLGLIAALITCYLIPWLKERTTAQQQERLEGLYRIAVFAAEQLYGAGHGEDKLDYVVNYLDEKGIKVDMGRIEATVRKYFGHWSNVFVEEGVPSIEEIVKESEAPQTGT